MKLEHCNRMSCKQIIESLTAALTREREALAAAQIQIENQAEMAQLSEDMVKMLMRREMALKDQLQALSLDWQLKEMDAARYKWLRRQNVAEFKRLFVENIETGREFDDLVDELMMKRK